ncbi:phosphotransferase [Asanoa sp. WMMD1127]|uniref:phosphotransferase family protein n=1 Tax=Asanoa sp. WMMD1127 TaxID=3016107 RepID=UPI00241811F9|nr:phosphotransferase [Asanoa sp. WMMD1127]MDG4823461.1 phosphotransferase [Asanoa sp. WMMD1127]
MATTHELRIVGGLVAKRYTSWGRGEHRREWATLRRIHRDAAGLAPQPVHAALAATPPTVTMTFVPGEPLAGRPSDPQLTTLATALHTLWTVGIDGGVDGWADDLAFGNALRDVDWPNPPREVAAALAAAARWWDGPDPDLLRERPSRLVLGHRDPNLANYLWDGRRIRIVDFEDARASDPATEVALLAEHLSARDLDFDRLAALFEVDERRLRAARRLWAMFWLALLRPGGPASARNPADSARRQADRLLDLLR